MSKQSKSKTVPAPKHPTRRWLGALYPLLAALLLLVTLVIWYRVQLLPTVRPAPEAVAPTAPAAATPEKVAARLVDEGQCAGCHTEQAKAWWGSHHQLAMQDASEASVLGDFNDTRFEGEGETTHFFRKDGRFWVNTPGADGRPADFRVAYAFGVAPLQQYLIEVPGGRLQALGVAWDVDKRAWFHLYPGQGVDFKDPLHWSRPQQNANFMCVECHTTGFKRNYDPVKNSFASSWNSLGVGCQACHGPASQHLEWAAKPSGVANAGFALNLAGTEAATEVETCARCHARRAPLGDGYRHERRLMDDYLPSALTRELFELDGKIKDEVFEYGAFTQSKMFAKGVRCSNCHNVHGTDLKAPGNGVCLQCHNPSGKTAVAGVDGQGLQAKDYESAEHHRHIQGQAGSQCVDCHMPGKLYMVNDYRHDHGFSVPNPARAQRLGTPDACLGCHSDSPGDRIAEQFRLWYGADKPAAPRYDESLWLVRNGQPGAAQALLQQLATADLPAIRRATLLAELPAYPSAEALRAAIEDLTSPAPQVREAAVRTVAALLSPEQRGELLVPRLSDSVRAVRIAAAYELLGLSATGLGRHEKEWDKAIGEYEAVQLSLQDRAEANFNLAMLYQASGRSGEVEPRLRQALQRDADFLPALVGLVQWLDGNSRREEGRALLDQGIKRHPRAALLRHADGLMRVRQGDLPAALLAFAEAVRLAPQNGQYDYTYAVALHDSGQKEAAHRRLQALLQRDPANRQARLALIGYWSQAGQMEKAQALLAELQRLNPGDPLLQRAR